MGLESLHPVGVTVWAEARGQNSPISSFNESTVSAEPAVVNAEEAVIDWVGDESGNQGSRRWSNIQGFIEDSSRYSYASASYGFMESGEYNGI